MTQERTKGGPDPWDGEPDSVSVPTPMTISLRETQRTIATARVAAERRTLTVISGASAGEVFVLRAEEHIIGRGEAADLVVADPDVSRAHARVSRTSDGRCIVEDLGSTNGTFVGGERIDKREIAPGDRVQCGPNLVLRYAVTDDVEEELQRRMYESSTRDILTRIFNRRYFLQRLVAELAHARRHGNPLAVLVIDVDSMREKNDRHGHEVGDVLLRAVAGRIARLIRLEDVLARHGGDKFSILARSTTHADAVIFAERIRREVQDLEIPMDESYISLTISVGVASLSELDAATDASDLIAHAMRRMHKAKASGKNRVAGA